MSFKLREAHWEVLVSFMDKIPRFATGKLVGPQGKDAARKLWSELALELNSLGLGEKPADKWQKSWTDIKYNIKKKGAHAEMDQVRTGGGPPESEPFNSFELRLLGLLGGRTFYAGLGVKETGHTKHKLNVKVQSSSTCQPPTPDKNEEFEPLPLAHFGGTNKEEPTCSKYLKEQDTNNINSNILKKKTKRCIDAQSDDHTYAYRPKKQKKKDTMDDAYGKTINLLENINTTLLDIKKTIQTGLAEITSAISARPA